jgi:hypothetical protein
LAEVIHAPYYALAIVGPIAMSVELWRRGESNQAIRQQRAVA